MFTFHDALQGLHGHISALLEGARLAALGCCTANLDANFAQSMNALGKLGESLAQLQSEQARMAQDADMLRQEMLQATSDLRQMAATMGKGGPKNDGEPIDPSDSLRAELEAAIASLTSMVNMKANAISLGELERLLNELQAGVSEMQKNAPDAELVEKLRKALKDKADRGDLAKIMRRLDGLSSVSRDADDPAASYKALRCLACDKPLPANEQPPLPGEPPELTLEPSLETLGVGSTFGSTEHGPFRERPKSSSAADRRRKLGSGPLGASGRPVVGPNMRPVVAPGSRDGVRSMKEAERLRMQAIQYGERPLHEQMMMGVAAGGSRPGTKGFAQGSAATGSTAPYSEFWAEQIQGDTRGPGDMSIGGAALGKKPPRPSGR